MIKNGKCFIILFLIALISLSCIGSGASSESFSNALYAGQNKMYTIQVPCTATISLDGESDSQFSLFAKKASGTSIPSALHVVRYADVSSIKPDSSQILHLDSGEWYVVVESRTGFAEYHLVVDKECPITTTCYGGPCYNLADCVPLSIYRDNVQSGFLNSGESKTFAYRLTENRSYVEWILSGPCDTNAPLMQNKVDVDLFVTKNCGPDLDLYVYQGCNPKYKPCTAIAADTGFGSNAYVGIAHPETDSLYYVKVYGKRGSGNYHVTARSYTAEDMTIAGINPKQYDGVVARVADTRAPDDLNATIPIPPTAYTIYAAEI
ncbi:MAG: hypothetical protein GXY48_12990 [Methanomicrobiales archaeon]|nr:hypothetical protein [Methanomicrobiales archaeon]